MASSGELLMNVAESDEGRSDHTISRFLATVGCLGDAWRYFHVSCMTTQRGKAGRRWRGGRAQSQSGAAPACLCLSAAVVLKADRCSSGAS